MRGSALNRAIWLLLSRARKKGQSRYIFFCNLARRSTSSPRQRFQGGAQAVPGWEGMAGLGPAEDPGDGADGGQGNDPPAGDGGPGADEVLN